MSGARAHDPRDDGLRFPPELEPIVAVYREWTGAPPAPNHVTAIRKLMLPRGHPQGYRFKIGDELKVLTGYTVEEVTRAVEDMCKAQHRSPDAIAGHLTGEYKRKHQKTTGVSNARSTRAGADQIADSYERFQRSIGAEEHPPPVARDPELDGRAPVEAHR